MAEEKTEVTQEVQETEPVVETPTDWQKQAEELTGEKKRLEQVVSKHAAEEQRLRSQVDSLTGISESISDIQDTMALHSDYFDELRGVTTEAPQAPKQGHYEQRQEQKKERAESEKNKPAQTEVDPEEMEAFYMAKSLIGIQGWDMEHPAVKKTQAMSSAKEALKVLQKAAKEENDNRVNEAVQQQLKDHGLTGAPPGGPSAPSLDDDAFMLSYSEGKSDDHARAQKILNKTK
ncbi:MAG TPA: hypothetical protein VMW45_00725 [Dehalococcoidia bacterium]|nr:hypothetical protein [Dehalococcoidia bacterium]